MIDHNLEQFGLSENNNGVISFPSEKGAYTSHATQRQFVIQARRAYAAEYLECMTDTEGLKVTHNSDEELEAVAPFIYVKLIVKPKQEIIDFANTEGEAFFDKVLSLYGASKIAGKRGSRLAFAGAFKKETMDGVGEVLVSHGFIGTSVFYNDYRVTTGFPETEDEAFDVVSDVYKDITSAYSELEIELSFKLLEDAQESDPFSL